MNNNANKIYQKFHGLSDEQYLELLCKAEQEPVKDYDEALNDLPQAVFVLQKGR